MAKILVLGSGMVGRAITLDLAKKHDVTATDMSEKALGTINNEKVVKKILDVTDTHSLKDMAKPYDLVVSAVPGFLGYNTMKALIESGKNFCDISFLPEGIEPLNELAKQKGVTGIMDMGVAPGMPNLIAGYHYHRMKMHNFEYYVGGLPFERKFPFEYKAPFSPVDVIEEYTRPARLKENGVVVTKPAMSETELMDFAGIGTLEAFNSDGLRSLLYLLPEVTHMKEKTLRYPGYIRLIQALVAGGFFSHEPIRVKNNEVVPFDVTTSILFDAWKLQPTEREFTVMRIIAEGEENGIAKRVQYDLFDEYDPAESISSMARTTGFTATAGAELILQGLFATKGVCPPEIVGSDEKCFGFVMEYLKQRNVIYRKS
jgi:saccharopine dehydrogenase-like NADP-dependent oxidoreductase